MEKIELDIIDLDDNGRGVAKKDGIIYFVEDAKYGELIEAEIIKQKKNFIEARKLNTLKKSKYIVDTNITENNLCGVYELYDIDYEEQVKLKKNQIINTINRISKENLEKIEFLEAKKRVEYRNKVELKLTLDGKLAYFKRNSNEHILVDGCVMNTPEINRGAETLQSLIIKYNISGYDVESITGVIKNIIIRSTSIGELMGIIVFNEEFDFKNFYLELEEKGIFDSFYVSRNEIPQNYKMKELHKVFGKDKIVEQLGEFSFNISPKAFMQVNKDLSYKIYLKAKDYIKKLKPSLILDMFSGISTTSILMSDIAPKIISVELNEDAVKDGIENAMINGISNIEFIQDYAEKAIDRIDFDSENTVALFDPPRKGLDKNIITKIGESKVDNIVYISCNPATLARDILRFKEYGFKLNEVTGIDQFVNTVEVEVLVLLGR